MPSRRFHILLTILVGLAVVGVVVYQSYTKSGGSIESITDIFTKSDEKIDIPYAVSTAHPKATEVGMEILKKGGNAIDAAIAISYALGVVEPHGSGIGGGGTMLIYPSKTKEPEVIDYREVAPQTKEIPKTGVPGFIKGMELAHQKYGKLPMKDLIQPSIDLAAEGIRASRELSTRLYYAQYRLDWKSLPHLFPDGNAIQTDKLLKQTDLAKTLTKIRDEGSEVFYTGSLAKKIVKAADGLQLSDLKDYKATSYKPLTEKYKDYEVVFTEPPGGGLMLYQTLVMADYVGVSSHKDLSADFIHKLGEVSKRVSDSKKKFVGDPKFVDVPLDKLKSSSYLKELVSDIKEDKISNKYKDVFDTVAEEEEHENTTHFVVIDKEGTVVSVTNTLSNFFGTGAYVDGFFLNSQLDNFSKSKKRPNHGAPGKKAVSWTAPTVILKNGKPILAIGSAGGRNIPPVLAEVIIRTLDLNQTLQEAVDETRFIVEKNTVIIEEALPSSVTSKLLKLGYQIEVRNSPSFYGSIQGIHIDWENKKIDGGADNRRHGTFKVSES
jgi:gamma-glutamyltranspeptidase/glutathione hydrolase